MRGDAASGDRSWTEKWTLTRPGAVLRRDAGRSRVARRIGRAVSWQHLMPVALLAATIALPAALAPSVYAQRGRPGATLLLVALIAMSACALAYALELGVTGLAGKLPWAKMKFAALTALPLLWLAFALRYTGRDHWLNRRNLALATLLPLLTVVLLWTNEAHGLVWSYVEPRVSGTFRTIEMGTGAWFWVCLGYSYGALLLGTGLLIPYLIGPQALYRKQSAVLLLACLAPWAANGMSALGWSPAAGLELTPFAFPLSVAALAWGLSRFRLLDIFPAARDAVIGGMKDGVIVLDSRYRVVDLNSAAASILRAGPSEMVGRPIYWIHTFRSLLGDRRVTELFDRYQEEGEAYEEVQIGAGPRQRTYALTLSSLLDGEGRSGEHLLTLHDVSRRKVVEDHLDRLAHYDALTGLPNRRLFLDRLDQAIQLARRRREGFALLFLDLDGFKQVNDTLGHEAGDSLLREVARRLVGCVREVDTVSRLAGDEFVVLLPEAGEDRRAGVVAERILAEFARSFNLEHRELSVTASVGGCLYPVGGRDRDTLLQNADAAMYRAKAMGKNRFEFYELETSAVVAEQLDLQSDLRRALRAGELRPYYQPLVMLRRDRVFGVEALVRWEHPERGTLAPADFLPAAEESGLIVPMGLAMLEEACAQTRLWQDRRPSYSSLSVCVNLSAGQFEHPNLMRDVARILESTGLSAERLVLEVPESAVMREGSPAESLFRELRDLGVKLAIDDFGAGHTSLPHLKRLSIDYLKIARSLIHGLERDDGKKAVVAAMIDIAHAFGLKIIAKGVENPQQLAFLNRTGCDLIQGHYCAEALSSDRTAEGIRFLNAHFP